MKVFNWNDISTNPQTAAELKAAGTGISIGSFDGIHSGHRKLLETLVANCHKEKLQAGVVTFSRPLPSIKHSSDYAGDLTTLQQRLEIFKQFNLDFVIVVNFDQTFAARSGTEFLDLLIQLCNLKILAEGVDFRCGYKGATDTQAIRYWAQNSGVETFFVDPVYYREGTDEEERISSSYIRTMIMKGFFTTAQDLLHRPYELDFSDLEMEAAEKGKLKISKSKILQVLPPQGVYHCKNESGAEIRMEITTEDLVMDLAAKKILF